MLCYLFAGGGYGLFFRIDTFHHRFRIAYVLSRRKCQPDFQRYVREYLVERSDHPFNHGDDFRQLYGFCDKWILYGDFQREGRYSQPVACHAGYQCSRTHDLLPGRISNSYIQRGFRKSMVHQRHDAIHHC